MDEPRRWSKLSEPFRGAGYVIALAFLVCSAGAGIAGMLVWIMT